MAITADVLKQLVGEELGMVRDRRVQSHIRSLLIEPDPILRDWDYGKPGEKYLCWTVLSHTPSNTGIAYCEEGFGPSQALGIKFERVEVRQAVDFEKGFKSAATAGTQAVLIQDDPLSFVERKEIARLGLKHRLPTVAGLIENAEAGAFVAYGVDRVDLFRRAAGFVDKILRGSKPADLPVEQATKLVLIINLKTAKAIGLTVSPSFLARADRVIE